jgi:poly-gamma-glutamate synthesis protein (capsule biosynthesis protein)
VSLPRSLILISLSLAFVFLSGCQAEATPAVPQVTLAFLGDVMLGRSVQPSAQSFAYLEPALKSADLALANLESPLSSAQVQTQSAYALCAAPEKVSYLVSAGLDLLSLSNNHALDCGSQGLEDTRETLRKAGMGFIGTDPVYREVNGLRLAFLAFDATGDFQLEPALRSVQAARDTGALVIVSLHWGLEYQSGASPEQKKLAAELAGAGASLIWGQHPHVLQPAEWINNHRALVLYSLGNALFDQHGLENTRQSALVVLKMNSDGVEQVQVIPFLIDVPHSQLIQPDPTTSQSILNTFTSILPSSQLP